MFFIGYCERWYESQLVIDLKKFVDRRPSTAAKSLVIRVFQRHLLLIFIFVSKGLLASSTLRRTVVCSDRTDKLRQLRLTRVIRRID